MGDRRFDQGPARPGSPVVGLHIEVVQDEGPRGPDRREAWIELDEADRRLAFHRQEHHRLAMPEALAQETAGPLGVGRLAVELAIAVEQRGDQVEVGRQGAMHDHPATLP